MSGKQQRRPEITIIQVLAGALAAVTAALLGSTLGVAGTMTGAAIASVVTTVGTAIYQHSFERGRHVVRTKVMSRAPSESTDSPSEGDDTRWKKTLTVLAAASALAFALGMGVITGLEWIRGEPLSGGERGSTVGQLFGRPIDHQRAPTWTPERHAPNSTTQEPTTSAGPTDTTTPEPTRLPGTSTTQQRSVPSTSNPPATTSTTSVPSHSERPTSTRPSVELPSVR